MNTNTKVKAEQAVDSTDIDQKSYTAALARIREIEEEHAAKQGGVQ